MPLPQSWKRTVQDLAARLTQPSLTIAVVECFNIACTCPSLPTVETLQGYMNYGAYERLQELNDDWVDENLEPCCIQICLQQSWIPTTAPRSSAAAAAVVMLLANRKSETVISTSRMCNLYATCGVSLIDLLPQEISARQYWIHLYLISHSLGFKWLESQIFHQLRLNATQPGIKQQHVLPARDPQQAAAMSADEKACHELLELRSLLFAYRARTSPQRKRLRRRESSQVKALQSRKTALLRPGSWLLLSCCLDSIVNQNPPSNSTKTAMHAQKKGTSKRAGNRKPCPPENPQGEEQTWTLLTFPRPEPSYLLRKADSSRSWDSHTRTAGPPAPCNIPLRPSDTPHIHLSMRLPAAASMQH
ncbi:hypothetical protein WJX84_010466 [Apatococcus fuscideae]|uniref:Uncharacterized protein n=1 Tax=Apatococcus fuscideae TaxID=2026836 RepID=A0AAW1TBY6_9CHLO